MWKALSCELSVASSDHEKDWFHHLKDVKLEVSVAGQLDGKIIQTMMVSLAGFQEIFPSVDLDARK